MNRCEVLKFLIEEFQKLDIVDSVAEARHALSWAEDCSLMETVFDVRVKPDTLEKTQIIIKRRSENEPLAYIMGERYFMGLRFEVCSGVLIPRQDTEILCEKSMEFIKSSNLKTVLDICTGSGAIGISLAHYTQAKVSISDISCKALSVAEKNAKNNNVNVEIIRSDLFDEIKEKFDMITANPPYISTADYNALTPDVHDYEPELALHANGDGLSFYRKIAENAKKHLNQCGFLMLEIGHDQAQSVAALLSEQGYFNIRCEKDIPGKDRVVYANVKKDYY